MRKWKSLLSFILLLSIPVSAQVTLPFVFSPGTPILSSRVNADFTAVADEINTHENAVNPHQTKLSDILALNNSCGTYSINFNDNQALNMEVENLSADPTPGNTGRIFMNTIDGNLKYDNGASIVTIAGSGVNNLSSVLNAGNSAGTHNLDMNEKQLLHARVENLGSDPSSGNAGRLYFNTGTAALMLDTGSAITAIGGSQGLSSVLGVSNSAGSTDIDFNLNQAKNMVWDKLSSDPGTGTTGRVYYNTASNVPKFYNGTSWLQVGNTNTLAQTLSIGTSVGSNPINFNNQQAQSMVLYNSNGSPGTGTGGMVWYDTGDLHVHHETSSANRTLADTDSSQTITNKSISGAANTITSIQDSSLSANVDLLNGAQTISAKKTFSSAPQISKIKTAAGTTVGHTIPDGLADDTFTLNNAVQHLQGKTLDGASMNGNMDFAENQAVHVRIENLGSVPGTSANAGRLIYSSGDSLLHYDDGSNWHTIQAAGSQIVTSIGALDNQPANANGLALVGNVLSSQSADATHPGMVNNTTQTISGVKTFSNNPVFGGLSASQAVVTDGASSLTSLPYTSANTASAVVSRDGSGNFSAGTITASITGNVTGAATQATTVQTSTAASFFPLFVASSTNGNQVFNLGTGLSFNPSTNVLSATTFSGALTGHASLDLLSSNNLSDVGTKATAFNNLSPMTTLGDTIYGGASGAGTRLAGDTTNTRKFLRELSVAAAATAPAWDTLVAGDIPNLAASIITSGTLATARGGTNSDSSGSTGVAHVAAGSWTYSSIVDADVASTAAVTSSKISYFLPTQQRFTSTGNFTYNLAYVFNVTSASATAASTYTNNSKTCTTSKTIASATVLYMTCTGAPSASGTLTYATGTGDATIAFSAVTAAHTLTVLLIGGGGGGGPGGTSINTAATNGANTTFGSNLTAGLGGAGGQGGAGGGGTNTINEGFILDNVPGQPGGGGGQSSGYTYPGNGGGNCYAGGGMGGAAAAVGANAIANTGGGGGGGSNGSGTNANAGGGGGGGGCIRVRITAPSATYSGSVGTGGAAGLTGGQGQNGGTAAAGAVTVLEEYN